MNTRHRWLLGAAISVAALACNASAARPKPQAPWHPDHTVIVVLENLSAHEATSAQKNEGKAPVYAPSSDWTYFNELAKQGAKFTHSHFGRTPYGSDLPTRPSQPNYLFLFSGHHQGVLPAWFADERSPYEGTAIRDRQGRVLPASANDGKKTRVGVANNVLPLAWLPLTSPNLGAAIMQTGGSFASFSESLPFPSWNCGTDSRLVPCEQSWALTDLYRRKHNPAINWTDQKDPASVRGRQGDLAHHVLPVSVNLGLAPTQDPVLKQAFRGFAYDASGKPLDFASLPTVSMVIPNEQNDAHSNTAEQADAWLRHYIGAYARWAMTHNSLLILTFDEDGSTDGRVGDAYQTGTHRIPTVWVGAGVKPGVYEQPIDHLNVLSTVLWLHGALDRFKADFKQFYQVQEGSGSEADLEYQNLRPVMDVFVKP